MLDVAIDQAALKVVITPKLFVLLVSSSFHASSPFHAGSLSLKNLFDVQSQSRLIHIHSTTLCESEAQQL